MSHDPHGSARHGQDRPRGRVVETAADVRQLLAEEIARMSAHPDLEPLRRARAVAQLARAALQAIELGTLAARLEAVEAALKLRKDKTKEDRHHE